MRNTIFTSAALALMAGPVLAEGPAEGCFTRVYSDAHLAKYPDQVVKSLRLKVAYNADFEGRLALMEVVAANQGHAARDGLGGQTLIQSLICWTDSDGWNGCSVECDGGSFRVAKDTGKTMTIRTDYLMVGDNEESCGGAIDLAERPGEPVSYRLNLMPDTACDGILPDEEN